MTIAADRAAVSRAASVKASPLKIAFYAPLKPPTHPVPSGDRRMARLLMAALAAAGHDVELACRLRSWDDATRPGRQHRLAELGGRAAARLLARYRARPRQGRPDAWFTYHLYHKAPDWLGPAISAGLGIPYVVAEASHAAKRAIGPWADGQAAAAAAIAHADAVIALSGADEAGLRPLLAGPERLVGMKPFLDIAPYEAAAKARSRHRATLAARLALPADVPWLLAVGMMREGDKLRSYRMLAEAALRIADAPWRLVVVGDGPGRAAVEAAFAGVAAGRLRFVGRLDEEELAAFYAAADLMVWPAVNEAYGMALLEAQAAGLPVVAGRFGGVPDVVRDGVSGILTPPGDAVAFGQAVAHLLADEALRAAFATAARRITAADHGLDAAARVLDAVMRRLTGQPP